MSYLVRYIKDDETIAVEEHYESPSEDDCRKQRDAIDADYHDICRDDD